jgi:hypothetical protein
LKYVYVWDFSERMRRRLLRGNSRERARATFFA